MSAPRGAGRSGGLLFLAVVLFVAFLAVRAIAGIAQLVLLLAMGVVVGMLARDVLRRR